MSFQKKDEPVLRFVPRLEQRRDDVTPHAADGRSEVTPLTRRKPVKISTVSHTLDADIAEHLRHFAFRERISESAVIEFALRRLFGDGDDRELGQRLRDSGAALRRRS